VGVGTF